MGRSLVDGGGVLLLAVDVALTGLLYERLPRTIAVHWTLTGMADNAGDRALAWLLPMCLGFVVALGPVARRHARPSDQSLVTGTVALGALYLFSASVHLLLANLDNETWQQGSVSGWQMLLVLTLPAVVVAVAALPQVVRSR